MVSRAAEVCPTLPTSAKGGLGCPDAFAGPTQGGLPDRVRWFAREVRCMCVEMGSWHVSNLVKEWV